jgi:hypothetical protein
MFIASNSGRRNFSISNFGDDDDDDLNHQHTAQVKVISPKLMTDIPRNFLIYDLCSARPFLPNVPIDFYDLIRI